ncbi:bifunctional 3-(3-hydroxy-phenyl)propionate/3-hydroxycinnamic acid hydroxylase [Amycolatopsis endophytica]|uniref:3-(3-hydroxy-phenyl)propionate hydroxylase n=1 Tax=Amycolatopsis endophytica TaxID=860233 RepID=A0A853BAI5_9PSEU|nr:bifunctional 3-(3-hydroxy-phenyl)propionate/3-hydroxycinnamic acid hydroxylase [Amycolatopsis endophytica]NYI92368.1 3-(3-hydroxy-phenyl)propionate hydroxylase [Amycolatopsis endophytica]
MREVVVVGAGPTGLTLANLLAQQGVSVTVLERAGSACSEPRAVALADESLRTLHLLGLVPALAPNLVWDSAAHYFGLGGRRLATTRPGHGRLGFPRKNLFDQPDLVEVLVKGALDRGVEIRHGAHVTGLRQDRDGVTVLTEGGAEWRCRYLVACDGGTSTVRDRLGIGMSGSSQAERWIVLDMIHDPHDERASLFYCDPGRPAVVVPGVRGRCRYEFMLLPGENDEEVLTDAFLTGLLARFRPFDPAHVRRRAVYAAHRLVARQWRRERVFLAGDAAHMMPPFAGQGLNSGIRDARNLAWKLAAATGGRANAALLDSYERERRPHSEQMVRLSAALGRIVMTTSRRRALARDLAFGLLHLVPPIRSYVTGMRFFPEPQVSGGCVVGTGAPVGQQLPAPTVTDAAGTGHRLDELLGIGWAVVALEPRHDPATFTALDRSALAPLAASRVSVLPRDRIPRDCPATRVFADTDAMLPFPANGEPLLLLVRPDRYICAAFRPGDADRVAGRLTHYLPISDQGE